MKKLFMYLCITAILIALSLSGCRADTRAIAEPEPEPEDVTSYNNDEENYVNDIPDPTPEDSTTEYEAVDTQPPAQAVNLQIAVAYDGLLSTFDYVHEVDYRLLREAVGGGGEGFNGRRLVVWADVPLSDFALMLVGNEFIENDLIFFPITTIGAVQELLPGQAFVINSYFGGASLPASGVTFVDGDGVRRYFAMQEDMSGNIEPNIFDPDILDKFEDGYLQIAITTDSFGGTRRYATISMDEEGNFDPDRWFMDNEHIWASYLLYEIENRIDQLPEDWVPWWED